MGVDAGHGAEGVTHLLPGLKGTSGVSGGGGGRGGGTLCIYGRRVARDRPGASMAVLVVIFCDRFSHMSSY